MSKALGNDHCHANPDAELFLNGCRGKIGFTSKRQAMGRLRVMIKQGYQRPNMILEVYHCKARGCGRRWHIGNSSRWSLDRSKSVGAS